MRSLLVGWLALAACGEQAIEMTGAQRTFNDGTRAPAGVVITF